jgi:hypothetical protein
MRDSIGWRKIYGRDALSNDIDLYAVPILDMNAPRITNVHCFDVENFYLHLVANPLILEEWRYFWPRLQDAGWEVRSNDDEEMFYVYPYVEECKPGIHQFRSKIALVRFIAR